MLRRFAVHIVLVGLLLLASLAVAQTASYSLDWWTVDNGGGTSSGGKYTLSGSIGQHDAGMLSGERYALEGGFWSSATPLSGVYLPVVQH